MPVPINWPDTGLDSLPKPGESTYTDDPGYYLDEQITAHATLLEAMEARFGYSSTNKTPTAGKFYRGIGTGQGAWGDAPVANRVVNGCGRTKQRATMPTTDNAYGFDHWRVLMENANGFTLSQEVSDLPTPGPDTAMKLTVGSGNNGKGGHWQPILRADCRDMAGGVASLQAKLKASHARLANTRMAVMQFTGTADAISGDPITTWGADGTNPTLATNWSFANTPASLAVTTSHVLYKIENIPISANAVDLAIMIWVDARTTTTGDTLIATDIQLEPGPTCTLVRHLSKAAELVECLFWLEEYGSNSEELAIKGDIVVASPGQMQGAMKWLPKRANPTISFSNFAHFNLGSPSTSSALTALSFSVGSPTTAFYAATTASTHSLGYGGRLLANTSSCRLTISAEP